MPSLPCRYRSIRSTKESDLAKHYLETLTAQENELAGQARDRTTAEQAQAATKTKLDDQIAAMKF